MARRLHRSPHGRPWLAGSLVLLFAAGGCSYFHHASKAEAAGKRPVTASLTLKPFLVNLADPGGMSFLRVQIALGLTAPEPTGAAAGPAIAAARDGIISTLTTRTSAQLLAPDGKAKLKQRLLAMLRRKAPMLRVGRIYFTDFLIQH